MVNGTAATIGAISATHGFMDGEIRRALGGVGLILHGGEVDSRKHQRGPQDTPKGEINI